MTDSYSCHCDYDAPSFYCAETRRARKRHTCYECGSWIHPKETYEHVRGRWDWDMGSYDTCCRCVEMRQWATISVPCFCWGHGDLHENVANMVEEVRGHVPGFFFEFGRRMVRIRREAAKSRLAISSKT